MKKAKIAKALMMGAVIALGVTGKFWGAASILSGAQGGDAWGILAVGIVHGAIYSAALSGGAAVLAGAAIGA